MNVVRLNPRSAYVAGSIHDRPLTNAVQGLVSSLGWEINLDWTTDEFDSEIIADPSDAAFRMIRAAANCDLFVLVPPATGGLGCFVEYGARLQHLKNGPWRPTVIYDEGFERETAMFRYPGVVTCGSFEALRAHLLDHLHRAR